MIDRSPGALAGLIVLLVAIEHGAIGHGDLVAVDLAAGGLAVGWPYFRKRPVGPPTVEPTGPCVLTKVRPAAESA